MHSETVAQLLKVTQWANTSSQSRNSEGRVRR